MDRFDEDDAGVNPDLSGGSVALITGGAAVGGLALRLFDRWRRARRAAAVAALAQRKTDADIAAEIRDELREDNRTLREEIKLLRDEVAAVLGKLRECEDRSERVLLENAELTARNEELAQSVARLGDQVDQLRRAVASKGIAS